MLVSEFIDKALHQIKDGLEEFNKENESYKAFLPESVDFDIAHIIEDGHMKVATTHESGYLKTTIHLASYPWKRNESL